jgi:hypothetical protein
MPHYRDMLRLAGVDVDLSDPEAIPRALIESGAFCYGDPPEIGARLDAYRAAGVDEIVVNMTGACQRYGARSALNDLMALFEELPPRQ